MKKESVNLETVEWFEKNVAELSREINKYIENKNIVIKIINKFVASLRFVKEYNEPNNKEIIFLLYFSCLNEFSAEWVKERGISYKFKDSFELKGIESETNDKRKYFQYQIERFRLLPTNKDCYIFNYKENEKISRDINNMSFYLQAYLNHKKVSKGLLLLHNYLVQVRNNLHLIHGNEKNELSSESIDNVTIEDCKLMLKFLNYLFLFKEGYNQELSKIFKKNNSYLSNNKFIIQGKIVEKYYELNSYPKIIIEYLLNDKIYKAKYDIDSSLFELYNISDQISIDFKISLIEYKDKLKIRRFANKLVANNIHYNVDLKNKLTLIGKLDKKDVEQDDKQNKYYKFYLRYFFEGKMESLKLEVYNNDFNRYIVNDILFVEYYINIYEKTINLASRSIKKILEGPLEENLP